MTRDQFLRLTVSRYGTGRINVSSFVRIGPEPRHHASQAVRFAPIIGVSGPGSHNAPGTKDYDATLAGLTGDTITVYPNGTETFLQLGDFPCDQDQPLTSDANGHGVPAGEGDWIGFIPRDAGQPGDLVYGRVMILEPAKKPTKRAKNGRAGY